MEGRYVNDFNANDTLDRRRIRRSRARERRGEGPEAWNPLPARRPSASSSLFGSWHGGFPCPSARVGT